MTLSQIWGASWAALGLPSPPPAKLAALLARYAEPHRAYHTAQHLEECLAQFALVRDCAQEPGIVELAIWYHDAVYWPRRSDNEQVSADLAADELRAAGATSELMSRVVALILLTTHEAPPPAGDGALLVDVDLAILGAEPSRYAEYERQVRVEYSWVPSLLFRRNRAEILRSFLARPTIYTTPSIRKRLEARARANLAAALATCDS